MSSHIELKEIEQQGNKLTYHFETSLKLFNKSSFFVEYKKDIARPMESMNALPFAAVMAPVSWATGADLIIPELDADYVRSLESCGGFWRKRFPSWSFEGRLVTLPVQRPAAVHTKVGMLFSSGLDSLATYIRHKRENPELFTVMGADFLYKGGFAALCKEKLFDRFAAQEGAELTYIYTDIGEVIDPQRLKHYAFNWYGAVQHGLMLTALTAPVSHPYLKTLLVASCSHKPDLEFPCGGDPEVIRGLRWGNSRAQDDLFELNRKEKIARYLKGKTSYYPYLRVCWAQFEEFNCSHCEKCSRTICELLLNNMNPNSVNFKITPETLPALRDKMLREYHLFFRGNEMVLDFWRAIQESVELDGLQDIYGSREFFTWLKGFQKLRHKSGPAYRALLNLVLEARDTLSHVKHLTLEKTGYPGALGRP